ncbi:MAG: hypothetical protein SEPTF4163_005298, partial [Sporothrix epigloea]
MDTDEEMRVMRQKEREADQMQYNARLKELQKERVREQEVLSSRFEEERQRLVSNFETLQATLQATMECRYKEQIADLTTKLAESSLHSDPESTSTSITEGNDEYLRSATTVYQTT